MLVVSYAKEIVSTRCVYVNIDKTSLFKVDEFSLLCHLFDYSCGIALFRKKKLFLTIVGWLYIVL